jgi:hypothetical protein
MNRIFSIGFHPVFLAITTLLFVSPYPVKADFFTIIDYSLWDMYATVNLDKSTYTPGENITVTGSVMSTPYPGIGGIVLEAAVDMPPPTYSGCVIWLFPCSNFEYSIFNSWFFMDGNFHPGTPLILTAPSQPGLHYVRFQSYAWYGGSWGTWGAYAIPFNVSPTNTAPAANITAPAANQTITQGTSVTFTGNGTDPDVGDSISAYEWRDESCETGALLSDVSSFSDNSLAPGAHRIYLRVRDSRNAWSTNCPNRMIMVSTNMPPCPATAISNCVLPQTNLGGAAGSCTLGYAGTCNYTCGAGSNWVQNSNSCIAPLITLEVCDNDDTNCVVSGGTKQVAPAAPLLVRWTSTNASFCQAIGGTGFSTGPTQDTNAVDLANASAVPGTIESYTVACGNSGVLAGSRSVIVTSLILAPTLRVSPRIVNQGSQVSIIYDTKGQTCTLTGEAAQVTGNGSVERILDARTTYTLECPTGSVSATAEIVPIEFES